MVDFYVTHEPKSPCALYIWPFGCSASQDPTYERFLGFAYFPGHLPVGLAIFFLNLQVKYNWNRTVWVVKNIGKGFT